MLLVIYGPVCLMSSFSLGFVVTTGMDQELNSMILLHPIPFPCVECQTLSNQAAPTTERVLRFGRNRFLLSLVV